MLNTMDMITKKAFTKYEPLPPKELEKVKNIFSIDFSSKAFELYNQSSKYLPSNSSQVDLYKLYKGNIDCFSFVWVVMRDMSKIYGFDFPTELVYGANIVLDEAVSQNLLSKFQNVEQLDDKTCGIFLLLYNSDGLTAQGHRHMGFWFKKDSEIRVVDFWVSKKCVVEQVFSPQEFDIFLKNHYLAYI